MRVPSVQPKTTGQASVPIQSRLAALSGGLVPTFELGLLSRSEGEGGAAPVCWHRAYHVVG